MWLSNEPVSYQKVQSEQWEPVPRSSRLCAIADYLGSADSFDEAIGDYSVSSVVQVEAGLQDFIKAVRSRRPQTDLSRSRLENNLR
jgi:hypothetical protein